MALFSREAEFTLDVSISGGTLACGVTTSSMEKPTMGTLMRFT